MSDETMLTIEQVETVIKRLFDEYGLASQSDLAHYAKTVDVERVQREISGVTTRLGNIENQIPEIKGLHSAIDLIAEQTRRTHDYVQGISKQSMHSVEVAQGLSKRVDRQDESLDSFKSFVNSQISDINTFVNDIQHRSDLTVELSKRTSAELAEFKAEIKADVGEIKRVVHERLDKMERDNETRNQRLIDMFAKRVEEDEQSQAETAVLLDYVRRQKFYVETVGSTVKWIAEKGFSTRGRAAASILLGLISTGSIAGLFSLIGQHIGG